MVPQDDVAACAYIDRGALGKLYDQYLPRIFGYCVYRLYSKDAAEDITSAIFLQVVAHIRDFDGRTDSDFSRWIYGIAVNEINAHIRKASRRKRLLQAAHRKGAIAVSSHSDPPNNDHLDWPVLHTAIQRLKTKQQQAITLRYFEGLSSMDISKILDIKPGAVRTMLSRATSTLREYLGDQFEGS